MTARRLILNSYLTPHDVAPALARETGLRLSSLPQNVDDSLQRGLHNMPDLGNVARSSVWIKHCVLLAIVSRTRRPLEA